MIYTPTVWTDEVPETTPVRYLIKDSVGGVVEDDATIEVVTNVTAGTPLNAVNLNHMEEGIEDAHIAAAAAQSTADAAAIDAAKGELCYDWRDESVTLQLNGNTPLTTNDKAHWMVSNRPKHEGGLQLVGIAASCLEGSTSGVVTLTLKKYIRATDTWVSVLTTNITIDVGELDTIDAAVSGVIDGTKDGFVIGDKIMAECTAAGTGVTHCQVECVFRPIEA